MKNLLKFKTKKTERIIENRNIHTHIHKRSHEAQLGRKFGAHQLLVDDEYCVRY